MPRAIRYTFAIFALLCACGPTAAAADASHSASALLRAGWGPNPALLAEAEGAYEAASESTPDARLDYAIALVRLKHRKFPDALTALNDATERSPGHLAAWRAKFWVLALLRKNDACLAEMQALANIYPEGTKAPAVEAELVETALWMGRLHGHFSVAAPSKLPVETRTKALAARLSGDRLAAFDRGIAGVRTAHEAMVKELEAVNAEEAAKEAERRAKIAADNKDQLARIMTDRADLIATGKAAEDKANEQIAEVDSELGPLRREYADLEARARPIQRRINELEDDIRREEVAARTEKDERRKRDHQREADRLRNRVREEERRLDPIQNEANRVQRAGAVLEAKRNQIAGAFQTVALQIRQRLAVLAKEEQQVQRSEKALLEPAKPTPRQTSMAARLTAVTSWQQFPLEEERLRLLGE